MPDYREIAPPPHLAGAVECFWTMSHSGASAFAHRVVPDGCADILFTRGLGKPTLMAVGAMTQLEDFPVPSGLYNFGVRFRPGMWTKQIGIPGDRLTNKILPLEDLWGVRGRKLLSQLVEARSPEQCASTLAEQLGLSKERAPIQRALECMEKFHGQVSLDWLAGQSGLSARQFRRVCIQQTGLSPKFLARVLRFRHALSKVHAQAGDHACLAAECGYTDQSHFIAEFKSFSGHTPSAYLRSHF
jgi:AraC-like DNA-binding protein